MPLLSASQPAMKPQETPKKAAHDFMADLPSSLAMVTPSRPPRASSAAVTPSGSRPTEEEQRGPYPIATLMRDSISDVMAARLTSCLIGHVLFLKSQIPYPVSQYPRMSQSPSKNAKAVKKQDDFFSSLDVLFSHLSTTFTALANSLSFSPNLSDTHQSSVDVAIVLGANTMSMSAAKARVFLRLDGLLSPERPAQKRGRPRPSLNGNLKENIRYDSSDESEEEEDEEEEGEEEEGEEEEIDEDADSGEDDIKSERSSLKLVEDEVDEIESVPDSDEESESDELVSDDESDEEIFDGETEEDIIAGERTLSRALAIANGEAEKSMSADLHIMHTHILLRAPRRFSHPSWIPQQSMTRDMDSLLPAFDLPSPSGPSSTSAQSEDPLLRDVTNSPKMSSPPTQRTYKKVTIGKHGIKTECVRVRCQNWEVDFGSDAHNVSQLNMKTNGEGDEDNEMLWWSWNGKLEGFELL